MTAKPPIDVADVFSGYPNEAAELLLVLRRMIFEVAAETDGVGTIEETLKWGEPAYLTTETKAGSTIRLGWKKSKPGQCAIYFNCQTTLVDELRAQFGDELSFEGNRAVVFKLGEPIAAKPVEMCIAAALTYHLRKKRAA